MCISIPAQVLSVDGRAARVLMRGAEQIIYLAVEANPGDWILLYAGVGIKIVDDDEAQLGLMLLESNNSEGKG